MTMKAKYRVNQLNRVHDSLVTASLDRGLIQNADEGDTSYLRMPPTLRLEYTPDTAPPIGSFIEITVELMKPKPATTPHPDPYIRKTVTAELELEIPPGVDPEDAVKEVIEKLNEVAMNYELVCAWTVESD